MTVPCDQGEPADRPRPPMGQWLVEAVVIGAGLLIVLGIMLALMAACAVAGAGLEEVLGNDPASS